MHIWGDSGYRINKGEMMLLQDPSLDFILNLGHHDVLISIVASNYKFLSGYA